MLGWSISDLIEYWIVTLQYLDIILVKKSFQELSVWELQEFPEVEVSQF